MNITSITGDAFVAWVLGIVGAVFIIILVVRAVGSWAKKEWGELVIHLAAAIFIAGLVYFPNQVADLLKGLWRLIVGG